MNGWSAQNPDTGRVRHLLFSTAPLSGSPTRSAPLAAVDPNRPGHYPGCPFLLVSGLYCPGCGSLRAVHDLAHGDLAGALARNPLAVAFVPFLLWALGLAWSRALGRTDRSLTEIPAPVVWALLGLILGYGVLRNIPGWTWLSPA